uniref:Cyclin-dependent kinases regulatory subunit n=1 Tax=Diabrotica virgifera virgifera TaxID=50390 RepID=A0A6P7G9E2_DIAVI
NSIYYSDKYYDDVFEYRHVVLPKEMVSVVPKTHLMSEDEWRGIGVQQSKGWVHYMIHLPGKYTVYKVMKSLFSPISKMYFLKCFLKSTKKFHSKIVVLKVVIWLSNTYSLFFNQEQ